MGKYDIRENYELLYRKLESECNIGNVGSLEMVSDYQLITAIDTLLRKLRLIPFTQIEINDISSNMN